MNKWIVLVSLTQLAILPAVNAAAPVAKSELARVAILPFNNASNSADYEWVQKSLPDAINTSMGARFEFIRQNESAVSAIAKPFVQLNGEYSEIDANKIAKSSNSDILIYGSFRLNATKDALVLQAIIYNAQGKRVIGKVEDTSPLDAKIFRSIDRLSAGIVEKIYAYALAAEQGAAKSSLKILVLVPQFDSAADKEAALKELDVLRDELSETFKGRYLTIYEFFKEYRISTQEQENAGNLAKQRNTPGLIKWLAAHGVENAFVVLVSNNKVNITPVAAGKPTKPVSYAVNALPAEKQASIAQASKSIEQKKTKVELTKTTFIEHSKNILQIGITGGKGILDAGTNLGVLTGISVHYSRQMWKPWFKPQVRLDTYYALKKSPVDYLFGASLEAGLGYTFLFASGRFGLTPYLMGGLFAGYIQNTAQKIGFYLPVISGGITYSYYFSSRWGISFNTHAQYVIDSTAPGLFFTGTVAGIYRF